MTKTTQLPTWIPHRNQPFFRGCLQYYIHHESDSILQGQYTSHDDEVWRRNSHMKMIYVIISTIRSTFIYTASGGRNKETRSQDSGQRWTGSTSNNPNMIMKLPQTENFCKATHRFLGHQCQSYLLPIKKYLSNFLCHMKHTLLSTK